MQSRFFLSSCHAVIAASALLTVPAYANEDDAAPPSQGTLTQSASQGDTIVVTARRREESLQEVPVSIAVLGSEEIASRGIDDVSQVANLTPGLQFDRGASPADIRPSMRGVALVEGRSNVAIVVDGIDVTGVSLNTTVGGGGAQTATALMDLERIEVVRGPQTVYFGRSAFAGAIQFISRDPEFDFGGSINAAIGNYDTQEITGHVTGPLIDDTVAFKLSGTYSNFGGYYKNPGDGIGLDALETVGVGGALLVETGPLTARVRANYISQDAGPGAGFILPRADTTVEGVNYIGEDEFDASQVAMSSDHEYAGNNSDTFRATLDLEIDLGGGLVLNSLTGFNSVASHIEFDFDKKPDNVPSGPDLGGGLEFCLPDTCVGIFDFDTDLQQISSELRLSYDGGNWRGLVGAFLFDENYQEFEYTRFVGAQDFITSTRDNIPVRPAFLETNTYSAFASLEYDVTDQLTATGEIRFNHEIIEAAAATGVNILFLTGSNEVNFRASETFNSWLPRFSLNYAASPDLNLYATLAKGSKPGGFNTGQVADELRPFGQETIWTYEIGAKGTLFDLLSLEASAYYSDWSDLQVTTICYGSNSPFGPEPECPTSGAVSLNYIINADKATVRGVELAASMRPVYWLSLGASYAYTDSEFEDFVARDVFPAPAGTTRQFGGNRVQLIPRHSLTTNARVDAPLTDKLDGFLDLTGTYRSSRYARFDNRVLLDDKFVANAQIGVSGDNYTALIYVNNIFDDLTPDFSRYWGNFNPSSPNGEYITAPAPRSAGFRLIIDF